MSDAIQMNTDHDVIDVDPDSMPYEQEVEIDGESKIWGFKWNDLARFFTVDLYEVDGTPIYRGEILRPYQVLWKGKNIDGLPADTIMVLDESWTETELDPGTFGTTFKLCILDRPGDSQIPGVF